jgi:serine/threonine-protein kinase
MSASPSLPEIGDIIAGKYRVEKVVGEGGMGIVFAAHHLMLDQRVAVKVLLVDIANGEEIVERFVREAQAAARVRSDHVVRVMDAGSLDSGLPFLVMEYLEGCDLDDVLASEGALEPTQVCDYMLQVLAALAQAHAAGIVHRDLKPANVFRRTPDGGPDLVKILDFGISKQESNRAGWKQLTGQTCLGTPAYMSPEQLRSSKNVDARADLWSLGVMMYELLTKELPFDGETPSEIFAAILEKTPTPLASLRRDIPDALSAIIMRALCKDPDERFEDAGELAQALAPLGSGKWAHLVEEANRSVARIRKSPPASSALVTAAIAAAHTARPPAPVSGPETPLAFDIGRPTLDEVIAAPEVPSTPAVVATRIVRARPAAKKITYRKIAFALAAVPMIVCVATLGRTHKQKLMAGATVAEAWIEWTWNGPEPVSIEKPVAAAASAKELPPPPAADPPPTVVVVSAHASATSASKTNAMKHAKTKPISSSSPTKHSTSKAPTYVEWKSPD